MAKRKIITIDENKCNGCALCIPNCPEGAIQVIDQKARLISDLFCDGLGACIGHCPQGAITIEEREAGAYDEKKVMANIVKQGLNVIRAHLSHLKDHNELIYLKQAIDYLKEKRINIVMDESCPHDSNLTGGCPGSRSVDLRRRHINEDAGKNTHFDSELSQWPVQLRLVPVHASYFQDAQLLIAADCVPFACANFHQDFLKGKILLVGCPKLDDLLLYKDKLGQIFANNDIQNITYVHMEVPCCFGLLPVIQEAIAGSAKRIPFTSITISIKGEKLNE